jgi:Na+/melibiose symporter-like transporter
VRQLQSDFTVFGLRLTIGIIPGIIILIGALIFSFFPIYGKYYNEIKSKMKDIQKQRKDKYIEHLKHT